MISRNTSRKSRRKIARPRRSSELYDVDNEDFGDDKVTISKRAGKLPKADGRFLVSNSKLKTAV